MEIVKRSILKKVYMKKEPWAHKGHYGRLLIVAGSEMMTGAPILVGKAALRAGVDVVYFMGPRRAMDAVANAYPTFINKPLETDYLKKDNIKEIVEFAAQMRVTGLALGPGLWRTKDTRQAILEIIEIFDVPMVIDADAVRAAAAFPTTLAGKRAVLTPHVDEFRELTGETVPTDLNKRIEAVQKAAKELDTVILLKGHVDVISDGRRTAINKTGNVAMTKGGFGDTLTGICAAFLSRQKNQVDTFTAACAAAFINGAAGDLAARKLKGGVLPTDLIEAIPRVIPRG